MRFSAKHPIGPDADLGEGVFKKKWGMGVWLERPGDAGPLVL
jgi:hypothetical protein